MDLPRLGVRPGSVGRADRPDRDGRVGPVETTMPRTATRIALLALLLGAASLPAADEAPRKATERELDNLVALTRLLGYVRYFHPSDESAAADWNVVAIEGVLAVEK